MCFGVFDILTAAFSPSSCQMVFIIRYLKPVIQVERQAKNQMNEITKKIGALQMQEKDGTKEAA